MKAVMIAAVLLASSNCWGWQPLGGTEAEFAERALAEKRTPWPPAGRRMPAITEQEAQRAHANGSCGKLGPGTGLGPDGRGWVVSMLPGRHEFRVADGLVGVTVAKLPAYELDVGRPYYIAVDARPGAVLEWRMAGHDWGPVATAFLYPPTKVSR